MMPSLVYDPRDMQLHRPPPQRDVPFVPTDERVVAAMLDLAGVGENDVLYDLGCGDGRLVIAAAKRGARGVGVDIDPKRIQESHDNAARAGVGSRVRFLCDSFFDVDLRTASVITLYLLPSINLKLRPKLLFELTPGSRIISNNFDMKEWTPDEYEPMYSRTLYKWIVPAWVSGMWKCVLNHPKRGRCHARLDLRRRLKHFGGSARLGAHEVHVNDGRLIGNSIRFTLWHPEHLRPAMQFLGDVSGSTMRGTCQAGAAGRPFAWCASRCDAS